MTSNNYILFDPSSIDKLLPLAYTRSVSDFRVGIFTIKEKWKLYCNCSLQILTRSYLQPKYPLLKEGESRIYVNGAVLPNKELLQEIKNLPKKHVLKSGNTILAYNSLKHFVSLDELYKEILEEEKNDCKSDFSKIENNWDIFTLNGAEIVNDIQFVSNDLTNPELDQVLKKVNSKEIYVGEGAKIEACILNASEGPIYIGKHAKILDGAIIKGPVSIGDHAVIKAGAKIYGETTIGPNCKVGGEVSNCVFFAYSNKGHDGYLGNSVIGEWCNLGADTNTSNLKNNYSLIKSWSYPAEKIVNTGLQFCGLIMADHAKCGINTMFNTATVVGVAANVFGGGFPPKFIPSFSWGGSDGITTFKIEKAYEMAQNMMKRRHIEFNTIDENIFKHIFNQDEIYRK